MRQVLRFEVEALIALPSARWLATAAVLLSVGVPLLVLREVGADAASLTLLLPLVVQIAQYPMLAVGCVAAGHQFGSGVWQTRLLAVPRRVDVAAAQAIAVVAAAATLAAAVAAAFVSTARLAGATVSATDLRQTAGTALYLALLVVLGWATTFAGRSTVVALAALSSSLLIVPAVAQIFGSLSYLPGVAGTALFTPTIPDLPGAQPLWLLLWTGAACAAAILTAKLRDCGG
ncbi:hypothetical protein [Tessaracoccus caeni]|uniref:hypothetical protein n=1 Tax=Tessaracoccus caeni TaxID=3031239 RepID=UPI0023DA2454|nr:hypothetical protein [Tessaracoccus caeni]MDF1486759.1 hypothetical protein [Tessaracoccus caeni]